VARDRKKSIRMSTQEEFAIMKKAAQADMDFSTFVRKTALEQPVVVISGIRELYVQVAKVGNNLNQLTMLCHQGKITCVELKQCQDMLENVYTELQKISDVMNRKNKR
jgi:hypothetical protein